MGKIEQDRYNRLLKEILLSIVGNQKILKALKYDQMELIYEEIKEVDVEEMMGSQIFHYKFIPNVDTEATSYLCVSIGTLEPKTQVKGGKRSDDLISMQVHCDVIVSNSIATLNGGNRSLFITNEIVKTLQGESLKNSIGMIQHVITEQVMTMSDFHGYYSVFEVYDFVDSYNRIQDEEDKKWGGWE